MLPIGGEVADQSGLLMELEEKSHGVEDKHQRLVGTRGVQPNDVFCKRDGHLRRPPLHSLS